ncbi:MAG: DUF2442 domain-containing protein [Rhizobiales bacterium]|nr:DUF2442 domain-containing protein [Hyphomicrobiales bacterium]
MKDIRIKHVEARTPTGLYVHFEGERARRTIDLGGWIATGGEILAPLRDPELFARVKPSDYGAAISWDNGDGDLSIDALHLKKIADEQRPFDNGELRTWQQRVMISNAEAADFVGVSQSTWATYRVNANIPRSVGIAIRASERDPLLLQAHLRPRRAGRPRKTG